MSGFSDIWNGLTGGPKTTTTSTTETPTAPSTNWGMIIGGSVLGIAIVVVLYFVFKPGKKTAPAA